MTNKVKKTGSVHERIEIGKGAVSTVYFQNGMAIKSFCFHYPEDWIKYEVHKQNKIVENTSLLVPSLTLNPNTREINMKFIDGLTLGDRMRKQKYKEGLADLISLQLEILSYQDVPIDNLHIQLEEKIHKSELSQPLKEYALKLLTDIPVKTNLCHMDFHFLNIMFDNHSYYILDWVNAGLGNPVLDIARTYIILLQYTPRLANKYLKTISEKRGITNDEMNPAIRLMSILRLMEVQETKMQEKLLQIIDIPSTTNP